MKRAAVLLLLVASTISLAAQGSATSAVEKNRILGQRFHLDILQKKDLKLADEIIAPDCIFHMSGAPSNLKGPARAKEITENDWKHYPKGLKLVHDYVAVEGNLVAFHWFFTGTPETGEPTKSEGLDLVKIENGKIAEVWIAGIRPTPAPATK